MISAPLRKRRPAILATSAAALLTVALLGSTQKAAAQQFWDGPNANNAITEGGSGTWNSVIPNWTDASGTNNGLYNPAVPAFFGVTGGTVTLGENLSFTSLTFQVPGYTIAGAGFTLAPTGAGVLNALNGAAGTIGAQLTGAGGITIQGSGSGAIVLTNAANNFTGGTTLESGTLVVNATGALGTGTLTITSPGGGATLGSTVNNVHVANNISVLGDFTIRLGGAAGDFFLDGNINLNGATRTITGGTFQEQIRFGGTISNGGLTLRTPFTAPGDYVAFIFDTTNVNTYTGLTTVGNGAFLVFQGATPNGAIQGDVLVEGNGVIDYLAGASEQIADTATVTVNSQGNSANTEIFTGFDLFNANGTETIGTLNGTGTVGLADSTLAVGAGNFSGVISDGFHVGITGGSLTKYGAGTLTLSGTNTYTGTTTISGGSVVLTGAGTLGRVGALNLSGPTAILDMSAMNAAGQTVGALSGIIGSSVVLGGKNLTAGGNNASTTFAGVISGAGGSFTKVGAGTTTFNGANTYTGATTVNRGVLIADTTINANVLSSASALVVGGGTFRLTGSAGNVRTQILNGLTVNAGQSVIDVNNVGTTTTLDLRGTGGTAGITRAAGGLVDFRATTGIFGTDAIVLTAQANDATGILGAWATVNNGAALAANNGAGVIVAFTGYTDIAALGSTIVDGPTTNVRINSLGAGGAVTLSAPTTNINTLTQNFTTASTVDTSTGTLRVGVEGGIFITPGSAALTIGTVPNSGILTAGGSAANVAGDLILGNFSGSALTINSVIANNGTGVVRLTTSGVVTLAGANTYTGATTIGAGTLALVGAGALANTTAVDLTQTASVFNISGITAASETIGSLSGVSSSSVVLGAKNLTAGGNGASTTFAGVMSGGGGSFTKVGEGTMTLTGANSYTGVTTVSAGALALNTTGANALSGNVVVNGGTVVLQQSNQILNSRTVSVSAGVFSIGANDETVAGVQLTGGAITGTTGILTSTTTYDVQAGSITADLAGTVGLTKTTAGTVFLSGINTYTGPTAVNGGTLVNSGQLASVVTVNNASTFTNNGLSVVGNNLAAITATTGNTVTNNGLVQGGATGSEGVVLTGADNIFTNNEGALVTADRAIVLTNAAGSNTVVNFGTLTGTSGVAIDAQANGAMTLINAGALNGNVLFGGGSDTLTLVTGQTSTGGFNGAAGTNALRLVGTTSDSLNLDTIINFSTLNKLGGGTWSVTGTGTFVGGSTVTDGSLYVQGNLISNVFVMTEGFLGGNGIITGNLTNYGIVSPGNSPGKLVVKGDYTQGRSGTLIIEFAGQKSGEFDVLEVGGRANLDGTLRLVRVGKGPRLKAGDRLEFLTAGGGVQGKFADVENPFSTNTIIQGQVVYEDNAVVLEGTQGSFEKFARSEGLTPNQRSVAGMLDNVTFAGDEKKLISYLNERSLSDLPGDFDRIAPEELTAVYRVSVALADIQARNIGRRLEEVRLSNRRPKTSKPTAGSGAAGPTGQVEKTIIRTEPEDRWGAFFTGTGQVTRVGRTENARGYDLNTGGLTIGVDYRVSPNFALGMSAGYANTDADLTNDGNIRINGGKIGAYATYFTGGFHADGAISTGYNSYETRRAGLEGTARGRTDGVEVSALAGAGYDWKFEEFTIGPTASLQYAYVAIDEFTERGSLAPLRIPDQDVHSFSSTLGFASAYDWTLGKVIVRPEVRAAWRHEFGDRSFALDAQLPSGAGGLFTVQDSEVGADSFLLGAGVSVIWSGGTLIYVSYDGELGRQEYDAHNLSGGVRVTF